MKKLLAFLLTLVLVASCGTMVAFAADDSPEAEGVISDSEAVDANGKEVDIEFEKIDGKVIKEFADELDNLKEETGNKDLKIVDQFNVDVKGSPKYPVDVTLKVLGVSKSSKVYVLVKTSDGNIKSLEVIVKKGKISFSITENIKKLAIVVDKKTAQNVEEENNIKSPQTADYSVAMVIVAVLGLFATALVFKKQRV